MRALTAIGPLGVSLVLALLGCTAASGAQDPTPAPPTPAPAIADPEARLIEAELLELAEGRIDEALEIYRALLATPDLSPPLRARALFSIARAHRKRGELGAAKERYEELVADHPEQEKLVEAARRYLEEIAEGATRLPEFDWVAEVEENPQIQAQIFQWGMQLGGESEEARKEWGEARRKLLSLGVLVVPVLVPMLENSRDAEHREELARILIQLGGVRHIAAFVQAESSTDDSQRAHSLYMCILTLDAGQRNEALRVMSALPVAGKPKEELLVAAVRLSLGDSSHLEDDIRTLVGGHRLVNWDTAAIAGDKSALARASALLLEIEKDSPAEYRWLLERILVISPDLILPEQIQPLGQNTLDSNAVSQSLAYGLFEHHRPEFLRLLEGPRARGFLGAFGDRKNQQVPPPDELFQHQRMGPADWMLLGEPIPVEQKARILRAGKYFDQLVALAVEDDGAISELADFLFHRTNEVDPQSPWLGMHGRLSVFQTAKWGEFMSRSSPGRRGGTTRSARSRRGGATEEPPTAAPPGVSPALEAAMRDVFAQATDVDSRSTALELLVRAYREGQPESAEIFRVLLEDSAADPAHRILAFVGLLLRLPDAGAHRDADAERLDRFFTSASLLPEPRAENGQMLRYIRVNHRDLWREGRPAVLEIAQLATTYLSYLESDPSFPIHSERAAEAAAETLTSGRGVELFRECSRQVSGGWSLQLLGVVDRIDRVEVLHELASELFRSDIAPPPIQEWRRFLVDARLPVDPRMALLNLIPQRSSDPQNPERVLLDELDWRALLLGTDPLAAKVIKNPYFPQYIEPHRVAARASSQIAVQRWAWENAELPATLDELEPALASEDETIRRLGYRCLLQADDTRWLPALHRAAREAPTDLRSEAIDRLAFFSAEESLPVLTALLDDPVFAVRAKALEALEKIEATLSQQEKWRERFGKKKKG